MPGSPHPASRADECSRVAVLGDVNVDLILTGVERLPQLGTSVEAAAYSLQVGGSAANCACALAKLGLPTCLAGQLGDDMLGSFVRASLADAEVDVTRVHVTHDAPTGISVALSGAERSFVSFRGAVAAYSARHLQPLPDLQLLHVAGFHASRSLQPAIPAVLAEARKRGAITSLDGDWDPTLSWGAFRESASMVDILFTNEVELAELTDHVGLESGLLALAELVPLVVGKLGPRGSIAVHDGRISRAPGLSVRLVDSTGAGDCFNAAFLYARITGEGVERALQYGNAAGALATGRMGAGTNAPSLREIRALLGQ